MRFDYQPPYAKLRTHRYRRRIFAACTAVGLAAVAVPLLYSIAKNWPATPEPMLAEGPAAVTIEHEHPVLSLRPPPPAADAPTQTASSPAPVAAPVWKAVTIGRGDTLSKIFAREGIEQKILLTMLQIKHLKRQFSSIFPGQVLHFLFDEPGGEFKELKLALSPTKTLHVRHTSSGVKHYYQEKQLQKKLRFASVQIQDSLFLSGQSSGLDNKVIMQLANIFGWDIDFAMDIRAKDHFSVLYEEEYIDDEKVDTGHILAAEFVNRGKAYKAVRFTDETGNAGYYSPDGFSMQKAFLRTPVKFTRISSRFSRGRKHPILHKIRAHKGVDYAAPTGTPVKASGNGKISFIGTKGGYGKSVEIKHGRKYSTFYAHLHRFAKGMKRGREVKQGQVIGYVGRTGLASGPHLHYEFRINGVHRNPLTVKLPKSLPIAKHRKQRFNTHAEKMLSMLQVHLNATQMARND